MYHLIFFYAIFCLGRSKNNAIAQEISHGTSQKESRPET